MNPEVYPYPTAEELLESVCDEPFLVDTKLEELLPRFMWYTDDNFGCQIEIHTLCTIEGHTSILLTFGKIGSRDYFFSSAYKRVCQLVERDCQSGGSMVAPPYPVCGQCNQQHKCLKCSWAAQ